MKHDTKIFQTFFGIALVLVAIGVLVAMVRTNKQSATMYCVRNNHLNYGEYVGCSNNKKWIGMYSNGMPIFKLDILY